MPLPENQPMPPAAQGGEYVHTQWGTVVIVSLGAALLLLTALGMLFGANPVTWAVVIILALVLLLFYSLTIRVSGAMLEISFGIGLIRKRIPLQNIVQAFPVRNHWYYGWGIHYTSHGWLFNVSGLDAVELVLTSGKHYRLGTDQSAALMEAINQRKTRRLGNL